ncbi:MAG: helix-turn-helix transcriptional regulator [Beutenbergiaceae bacterium]
MENIRAGYGPAPTVDGSRLSPAQWAVITTLVDLGPDVSLHTLASAMNLHSNTIRGHLEALTELGLIARRPAPAVGRGRPAHLYSATSSPRREEHPHAALASSLASELASISPDPAATARAAGHRWGEQLAADDTTAGTPRQRVLAILTTLGFSADDDADVIRLHRCPLLGTARKHTEIVCGVHTGLVEGTLKALGSEASAQLEPFAEPGCCRLMIS